MTQDENNVFSASEINEATRVMNNDDTNILPPPINDVENPAAPVSKQAMSKTSWGKRLGIAGAAVAVGGGAIFAATAGGSDDVSEKSINGLAEGADPDENDNTPVDSAEYVPENNADLPNSISHPSTGSAHSNVPGSNHHESMIEDGNLTGQEMAAQQSATSHTSHIDLSSLHGHHTMNHHDMAQAVIDAHTGTHSHAAHSGLNITIHHDTPHVHHIPSPDEMILINDNGIHFAHVDDDMSFAQAFAAAREQVGPGGAFEWHGNVYGTYYGEEWNSMSSAERADYLHAVHYPPQLNHDVVIVETVPEIHIDSMAQYMDDHGHMSTVAEMHIDGTRVTMADTTGDGEIDSVGVDINGDGIINPDEIQVVPESGIHTSDISQAIHDQNMPQEPEIHVHSMSSYMDDHGNVSTVAELEIDGARVTMADTNGTGHIDTMGVDSNGDGFINPHEIVTLDDTDIHINNIAQAIHDQNMPDVDLAHEDIHIHVHQDHHLIDDAIDHVADVADAHIPTPEDMGFDLNMGHDIGTIDFDPTASADF